MEELEKVKVSRFDSFNGGFRVVEMESKVKHRLSEKEMRIILRKL